MIKSSENTDLPKQNPKKPQRFWWRLAITIAVILLTLWLILYLFSNVLFNTAIKRAFSKLTDQHYSLDFKDLKINLFKLEIAFSETNIIPSERADSLNLSTISFYSDTFIIRNIDFYALLKNKVVKLKSIHLKHLKINLDSSAENRNQQKLTLPVSTFLERLKISNFKVTQAEINYKHGNDSIFIPSLNFQLYDFRIDSMTDTVNTNRFHFSDIDLTLNNQQLNIREKGISASWKHLNLSTKEKSFELDSLKIIPYALSNENETYIADIPKFRLYYFEFDSLILKKQLLVKNFILDVNQFKFQYKNNSEKPDSSYLKVRLNALFEEHFSKIKIDSGQIFINESQLNLPKNQQINISGKNIISISKFRFNPKNKTRFSLADGSLSLNNFAFTNFQNKQTAEIKSAQINYKKQRLMLFGIDFISDSSAKSNLQLEEVYLGKIDWIQLLNTNKLVADTLFLKGGKFTQQQVSKFDKPFNKLAKSKSFLLSIFQSVSIKTILFDDWNYRLTSKSINAKNITAQLNQFKMPGNSSLAFGAFSDFNIKMSKFSWISTDQKHQYLADNIELNSKTQDITIDKIKSIPRWKSFKNKLIQANTRFIIAGHSINIQTQEPFHLIRLNDTLKLNLLSIDSLNLKKFGKNSSAQKLKFDNFPIHIYSFALRTGEYTAYNDSSSNNRLVHIKGIHLKGDSLVFLGDSLPSLNYRHLLASTKTGTYQNKAQGLRFNFQDIDFNSEDEAMSLHHFKAELSSDKNEKTTQHQINSKLLQIKGFDHNLFFQRNLFSAHELKINSPSIISKSQSDRKQPLTDFRNLFSAENIQKLPYLEFDRFVIQDFSWLATYTIKGITNITTIEKASFEAADFRLSYRSFTNPERLLFSKSIYFHIHNFKQHFRNGNYLLMVEDIGFSSLQKQMKFDKIQFYTLQKPEQNNYNFTIDRISLKEINFPDFQRDYSLSVENILIEKPITKMQFFGFDESSSIKNLNTLELYPVLRPYFSQISLNSIDVRDMNLRLEVPKGNRANIYNIGHLDLQMQSFKLDSSTKAFQYNRFFYTKNTIVHLSDYSARIANDLYTLNFKNLRASTLSGRIEVDSLSLKPQYNYADFAQKVGHQTDRFDIDVNTIKLSGIDFQDAIFRQKYIAKHAEITQLKGEAYRDGTYPRLPNLLTSNPIQRLLDLPYFIQADSIYLIDGFIAYKEKGEYTEVPGYIYFDKINAQIFNATNNPDFIKFGGHTVFKTTALLMGKSQLTMEANFPLIAQGKSFGLTAHINRIEMDDLDPILRPLALIQAASGTIKSVDLSVVANDNYAYGEMIMLYDNMKLEILNKSMKKGFFGTLFANMFLKTENPSYLIPRKGPIYFERKKDRSIFNYWAEISILGMKTSMGLADRRTAKKVKRLKKSKI